MFDSIPTMIMIMLTQRKTYINIKFNMNKYNSMSTHILKHKIYDKKKENVIKK